MDLDDLIRDCLVRALAIVRDADADPAVRERAAMFAGSTYRHLPGPAEADTEALLASAGTALEHPGVVRWLANAAFATVEIRETVLAPVKALADQAYREGHYGAFLWLIGDLLRHGQEVEASSFDVAFRLAVDDPAAAPAAMLARWLARGGGISSALREIIAEHADPLLENHNLSNALLVQIHTEVPTVDGWTTLIHRLGVGAGLPMMPAAFGPRLDEARRTLEEAISTSDKPSKVTLAGWLVEIANGQAEEKLEEPS
jgi:hypothetical protein